MWDQNICNVKETLYIVLCNLYGDNNSKICLQLEMEKKSKDFEDRFLGFNSSSIMWWLSDPGQVLQSHSTSVFSSEKWG